MSEQFDSLTIASAAYMRLPHDEVLNPHDCVKAVLQVLEEHGFLDIVPKAKEDDDG